MPLPLSMRRKRNAQVTKMLDEKFNIKVKTVDKDMAMKNGNWFIPTRRGKGELRLNLKTN